MSGPGEHQYTYLGTGSLEYQKDSQGTVQKTYAYTPANLLESVTHAGLQNPSAMTWDADGNRVSFTSSTGGTWQFVYDPTAGIPAVIEESGPVYYVREPNGALIVRLDGQYTNYYHFDALGSTRLLTNSSGAVTDTYAYDAWGSTSDHGGTTEQPYQFVGQLGYYFPVQDENFPLLQLGVRFYDPVETGRFTQEDPAHDGPSWYVYVDDCPTSGRDPHGLYGIYVPPLYPHEPDPMAGVDAKMKWCQLKYAACIARGKAATGIDWGINWVCLNPYGRLLLPKGDKDAPVNWDPIVTGLDEGCKSIGYDPWEETKKRCRAENRKRNQKCWDDFLRCLNWATKL